jgi:hypothetical protein
LIDLNAQTPARLPPTTLSGSSVDFAVPAGVRRVEIVLSGLSTNGTSSYLVRLGDSGGVKTTGYLSATTAVSGAVGTSNATIGFSQLISPLATSVITGKISLHLQNPDTNTWYFEFQGGGTDSAYTMYASGTIALSGALTTIRLTSTTPDTFDSGSAQPTYFFD